MMKKSIIPLFVVLVSVVPARGYHKVCHYSHRGSLDKLKTILGEHSVYDASKPVHYSLQSADGRRICDVRLNGSDRYHVKAFLNGSDKHKKGLYQPKDPNMVISNEMIQKLLKSREVHLKAVGWVLRDFKSKMPNVTVGQVRHTLGIDQE